MCIRDRLYYRRHSPQTILAWPSSETPKFEMSRALTAQAREPVLFVTYCRDPQRLAPYFRKVEPLGEFKTSDTVPRFFIAFRLEGPTAPIAPLPACETP